MVYDWKLPIYKISAQSAGEFIQNLADEHGEVTPELLLESARPEDSILHSCYEWDDAKAAEKYRLNQSKMIISNLIVVSADNGQEMPQTNAFVTIKERNEKAAYVSIFRAMADRTTKEQVIKNASAEMAMFIKKYENIINVAELLEKVLSEMKEQSK